VRARWPLLDRCAQIVEAQEQPHAGGDLIVGGVESLATDRACGQQRVDVIKQPGQG
jgi:hypothetical protein